MSIPLRPIAPADIEPESFRIIEAELGPHSFDPATFAVVRRVIHATGDFSFAETLRFHPRAIATGIAAIRAGRDILVEVGMAEAGVSKHLLQRFGGHVRCHLAEPLVIEKAKKDNRTRSEAAIQLGLDSRVGIVAVGNAPTALVQAMALADEGRGPDLVVGVPVGFVNAAESKLLLEEKQYPYITNRGRKGGTPAAVAIVNALIRLAAEA